MKMISSTLNNKYITNKTAKEKIKSAILELTSVVTSTMGPEGNTVIIPDSKKYGEFTVTKDGVSVAKAFVSDDHFTNIVVGLVKQVAEETVKEAGDGTTTSMLFVEALVELMDEIKFDKNDDNFIKEVVYKLLQRSKSLTDEQIYDIAKVSANGDSVIADTIKNAFTSRYTHVTVERGNSEEDRVLSSDGLLIASRPVKGFEHTASAKGITYDNALVAVTTERITDHKPFLELFKLAKNQALIIIAPLINDSVINIIKSNHLNISVVKTPGVADHRENLCEDIAKYLGVEVINSFTDKITKDHAGYASVTLGKYTTVRRGEDEVKDLLLTKHLEDLEARKEDQDDYTVELLEQRISRLKGSNSTIYVGGLSEVEQSERFDRYEDAVLAVNCALEQGYIKGGGVELEEIYRLMQNSNTKLLKVLVKPYDTISKHGKLYNSTNIKPEIIDPVKVTITALTRAYNFVKTIKSTNAIILGNYGEPYRGHNI